MILTEKQVQEFKIAAQPLMDWLKENVHPQNIVLVSSSGADLLEGQLGVLSGYAVPHCPDNPTAPMQGECANCGYRGLVGLDPHNKPICERCFNEYKRWLLQGRPHG